MKTPRFIALLFFMLADVLNHTKQRKNEHNAAHTRLSHIQNIDM